MHPLEDNNSKQGVFIVSCDAPRRFLRVSVSCFTVRGNPQSYTEERGTTNPASLSYLVFHSLTSKLEKLHEHADVI